MDIKNNLRATYSGISFPPRKSPSTGFFINSIDSDLIKESIHVILNTSKGSMPMVPDFGSSSYDLLFEPINSMTQGLIADAIKADISKWEPRVQLMSISASSFENTRIFVMELKIKASGELITTTESFSGR